MIHKLPPQTLHTLAPQTSTALSHKRPPTHPYILRIWRAGPLRGPRLAFDKPRRRNRDAFLHFSLTKKGFAGVVCAVGSDALITTDGLFGFDASDLPSIRRCFAQTFPTVIHPQAFKPNRIHPFAITLRGHPLGRCALPFRRDPGRPQGVQP